MEMTREFEDKIAALDAQIEASPEDISLHLERAKTYYRAGVYSKALNDFLKVLSLDPDNVEARENAAMIREIFAFRNLDMYNP